MALPSDDISHTGLQHVRNNGYNVKSADTFVEYIIICKMTSMIMTSIPRLKVQVLHETIICIAEDKGAKNMTYS